MARIYDRQNYLWVENVLVGGKTLTSSYNHNYYRNVNTGKVILEECNDDDFFDYSELDDEGRKNYIGGLFCVRGIFPDERWGLPDDVKEEEDGGVEVFYY